MTLELLFDALKRLFGALVSCACGDSGALDLLEEVREKSSLILAAFDAVHSDNHFNEQVADFARVLGLNVLEGFGGDCGGLLLNCRAVVCYDFGLVQVDFLCESLNLSLLLGGELFYLA